MLRSFRSQISWLYIYIYIFFLILILIIDQVIEGIIKEKEEAKEEYKTNKEHGNTVAYSEINEEAPDIMKI